MRGNAVARLVAAVALTAAAGVVLPTGPASAAACSSAHGVTVVVDFNQLGGGVQKACDGNGGGKSAYDLFNQNGFRTERVQSQPGEFVCRINGKPTVEQDACQRTPPVDAYWGLWWSDGESGDWVYSSESAAGLNVPDGGYVAFSWNGSADRSPPSASPSPHEPEPTEEPDRPGGGDGGGGGKGGGSDGGNGGGSSGSDAPPSSPSDSPSASASAEPGNRGGSDKPGKGDKSDNSGKSDKPGKKGDDKAVEDASETDEPSDPESSESAAAATTADPPSDAGDDGLPAWVAPVGIGALFAAAGVVALARRRATS